MEQRFTALLIFGAVYVLFVVFPARRSWAAVIGAALMLITRTLTPRQAFDAVNWNVMGVFVGTLVLADLFVESGMPAYLAERIVKRSRNACSAILFICLITGVISAFVENVAALMIVAPIAFSLARKLDVNPVKPLIAIAVSSNLQGAATLIGDPPSMLLAGFAKMSFLDFFVYGGRPSIFFAVQIGAIASFAFLYMIFRKERRAGNFNLTESVQTIFPSVLLLILILSLSLSSFFDPEFEWMAGMLCVGFAAVGAGWDLRVNAGRFLRRIKTLDWDTTFFLVGVFVLVGGVVAASWTEVLADAVAARIGGNVLFGFLMMVLIAVAVSAFVDNIPFLAAMLPVALLVAARLDLDPTIFLFGLLLGASIGGNITPIGAAANIVCVGLLRKEGYNVRFADFVKIGLPFTVVSVAAACAFVWIVFGP